VRGADLLTYNIVFLHPSSTPTPFLTIIPLGSDQILTLQLYVSGKRLKELVVVTLKPWCNRGLHSQHYLF